MKLPESIRFRKKELKGEYEDAKYFLQKALGRVRDTLALTAEF